MIALIGLVAVIFTIIWFGPYTFLDDLTGRTST